jgi:exonuclease VII small subunit
MPTKSFEERLARLEEVATLLKDGKIPLEEAVAQLRRARSCGTLERELAGRAEGPVPGEMRPRASPRSDCSPI